MPRSGCTAPSPGKTISPPKKRTLHRARRRRFSHCTVEPHLHGVSIMEPRRIDCIYWEAAQIVSEEERAVYLDRVCGADSQLRQRVLRLLKVRAAADNLLEAPAAVATLDEPVGEKPGTVIGPYKLLEQIGEGGMGLV